MIAQLFPKDFSRYLSLPVLGPVMDWFAGWLRERQYTHRSTQYELRMAARVCKFLRRQGVQRIEDVSAQDLENCHRWFRRKFPKEAGSVRVLTQFLLECNFVQASDALPPSRSDTHLHGFMRYLRDSCGCVSSTVRRQVQFADEFLKWLDFEARPGRLSSLRQEDVEGFVRHLGKRMGRVALQKPIATIRNFLRFLVSVGCIAPESNRRIDTPRVYRQEQLPCALPWKTVQAFLSSIDRNTITGIRDYAIFSLMVGYRLVSGAKCGHLHTLTPDLLLRLTHRPITIGGRAHRCATVWAIVARLAQSTPHPTQRANPASPWLRL